MHPYFALAAVAINALIISQIYSKLSLGIDRMIREAKGKRGTKEYYEKYIRGIAYKLYAFDKENSSGKGIYQKVKNFLKRAGYRGTLSVLWYTVFQLLIPVAFFIFTAAYRNISLAAAVFLMLFLNTFYIVYKKGRRIAKQLERSVYRIYKYLHNQVSAGVKVTDAIKSVFEVVDEKELKDILIRFAARYELTLDIDDSLRDFCSYFNTVESETLAVAIKQGVDTGDNQNILMRQEEVMFNKYLNYIQMETENAKKKAAWAMVSFMLIIIIMVAVPMMNDLQEALKLIFIN